MTYAVGYFSHFTEVGKEMFEMQQSLLWAALDNLDKFTDDIQNYEVMEEQLVDAIQNSIVFYMSVVLLSLKPNISQ